MQAPARDLPICCAVELRLGPPRVVARQPLEIMNVVFHLGKQPQLPHEDRFQRLVLPRLLHSDGGVSAGDEPLLHPEHCAVNFRQESESQPAAAHAANFLR